MSIVVGIGWYTNFVVTIQSERSIVPLLICIAQYLGSSLASRQGIAHCNNKGLQAAWSCKDMAFFGFLCRQDAC